MLGCWHRMGGSERALSTLAGPFTNRSDEEQSMHQEPTPAPAPNQLQCAECGQTFTPCYSRQRFCSLSCGNIARAKRRGHRLRGEATCRQCGKVFMPTAADRMTYCSRECSYARRAEKADAREAESRQRKGLVPKVCQVCGGVFVPHTGRQVACAGACVDELWRRRGRQRYHQTKKPTPPRHKSCRLCGAPFVMQGRGAGAKFCGKRCQRKADRKKRALERRMQERLRQVAIAAGESINPVAIFNRDGWTCKLCGLPVDRNRDAPDPASPTIDHIIPLCQGGPHTVDNVQCAHFLCNSRAGKKRKTRVAAS